jgi:predicted lipid carrier protein YhbT
MSTLQITGGRLAARSDNHSLPRRLALKAVPRVLAKRLVPEHAAGLQTLVELRVNASRGGEEVRFALQFSDGAMTVTRRAAPEASAWLGGSLSDLVLITSGARSWTELLAAGRLELGGDPFTALRVPVLLAF